MMSRKLTSIMMMAVFRSVDRPFVSGTIVTSNSTPICWAKAPFMVAAAFAAATAWWLIEVAR